MPEALKLMSSERQQEIVEAVKLAVDLHNDGLSPSDALAKVAADQQLNLNEVKLAVDAFNTSKTLAHMRSSQGLEKAASFELADYDLICQALVPVENRKVAAYEFDHRLPSYHSRPVALQEKRAYQVVEDQNGRSVPVGAVSQTFDRDPVIRSRRAYDAADYWRRAADEKRAEYDGLKFRVLEACQTLADHFKQAQHYGEWPTFAREALTVHGPAGQQVVDCLEQDLGLNRLGRHQKQAAVLTLPDEDRTEHKLLKIAVLAAQLASDVRQEELQLRDTHSQALASLHKEAADLGAMALMGVLNNRVTNAGEQPKPKEVDLDVNTGLESEYGNARAQLAMRDMLDQDEVLSQHADENPDQVFSAVRELAVLQPEILSKPLALRAALRRHLELGQTELHEMEQLKKTLEPQRQVALMNPGAV